MKKPVEKRGWPTWGSYPVETRQKAEVDNSNDVTSSQDKNVTFDLLTNFKIVFQKWEIPQVWACVVCS